MLHTWWQKIVGGKSQRTKTGRRKKSSAYLSGGRLWYCPRLEQLEDRTLLSAGDLDLTFGAGGKVTTPFGSADDRGHAVVIDGNGRIVVAGESFTGTATDFALARYNANGTLDTTLNGTGKVTTNLGANDDATSVAIDGNGRIVVAGGTVNGIDGQFALARYNADGTLDTTFDGDGKLTTDFGSRNDLIRGIAIDVNGKIIAVGETDTGAGRDFALARYNVNGSLDTTFDGTGKVTTDFGSSSDASQEFGMSVAIDGNGKIVVAGYFYTDPNGSSSRDFALARYNADGSLDTSFDNDGRVLTGFGSSTEDQANSVAIDANGKIIAAGYSAPGTDDVNAQDFALARYNANGSLDTSFDTDGKVVTAMSASYEQAWDVVVDAGRIVVAGFASNGSNLDFALARYKADGSLDTSFSGDGKVTTGFGSGDDRGYALAIDSGGRIVAVGLAFNGSNHDFALARYLGDTIVWTNRGQASDRFDSTFGANANLARNVIDAVLVSWQRVITNFNQPGGGNTVTVSISMSATGTGFGASASATFNGVYPTAGSVTISRGNDTNADGLGDGAGYFLDPTPLDNSEFAGAIQHAFTGDAQAGSPAAGMRDLFTLANAEITHVMGLYLSPAAIQTPMNGLLTNTGITDDSEGGTLGTYRVFDGPSVTHLFTSHDSGGGDTGQLVHSAGPPPGTQNHQPVNFNSIFRGNRQLVGTNDAGNARYEASRRYLVPDFMALVFKDAYNYTITRPQTFGTFHAMLNDTTGNLLIRGGTGGSSDNIRLSVSGGNLIVSVDIGNDPGGSGPNGDSSNIGAWVSQFSLASVASVTIQAGDGTDTVTLDFGGGNPIPSGGISIDGGTPTSSPGDNLYYNGPGTLNPGGTGSGTITQPGQGTISYTGIETVSMGIVPDRFEANDGFASATNLGFRGGLTVGGLSIHTANNDDYYRVTAVNTGTMTVSLSFLNAQGNVDLYVYDDNQGLLGSSTTTSDSETVTVSVTAARTYYIKVIGNSGATNPNYNLVVDIKGGAETEGFETGNFSAMPWVQGGNAVWTVTSADKHSGTYSARAGTIGNSQSTVLEMTRTTPAGNFSFWRKVSSESSWDFLRFYIDGIDRGSWSGEQSWAQFSYSVTAGLHTFRWTYSKDPSFISGSDTAWIDDLDFPTLNDAPVNSVPGAQTTNEDTPLVLTGPTALSISDVDAATGIVAVTLTATNGTINIGGSPIGLVTFTGNGTAVVNMTGTVANINTALSTLTFTPTANYNGTDANLQIVTNDQGNTGSGGPQSDTDNVPITVTAVNDAPVNSVPGAQTTNEDTPLVLTGTTALSIADVDAGTGIVAVTLTATNGTVSVGGNTANLVTFTGNGTTTVNMTGTVANINTALSTLTFTPTANYNGGASLQIVTNDQGNAGSGGPLSDTDTVAITVTAVNDAPVNGVPAAQTTNEDTPLVLTGTTALSISDVDAATGIVAVTLTATNGTITVGGSTANLVTFTGNGTSTVNMTGTVANINTALTTLTFTPTANYNGAASLQIVTNDQGNTGSGGPLSDTDTVQITVTAVNDAPVNTVPAAQTTNEDTPLVLTGATALSISDVDAAAGIVAVTLTATNGTITVGGSTANLLTFTGNGTATVSMTGTVANINTALSSLTFTPAANYNGAASLQIVTNDQGNTGTGGALTDTDIVAITVTAVNDAPVNSVPGAQTTAEDTPLVLTNATALSISDVDAATGIVAVTLTATNGTITVGGSTANLVTFTGNGTSTVNMTGTVANINTALTTLTFTPTANYNGTGGNLQIVTNDQGNTGSGGPLSDMDNVPITVTAVNDAPLLDDRGLMKLTAIVLDAVNNPGDLVRDIIASAGGDRITDVDAGAVEGIAVFAVNNSNGAWQFSTDTGTNWTPFGSPTAQTARLLAADANTRVRFVPVNFIGTVNPGITFRAWDRTSGANGDTGDSRTNGGVTPYSTATETAYIAVKVDINFDNGQAPYFEPQAGNWAVVNGRYVGTPSVAGGDAVSKLAITHPATNLKIDVLLNRPMPPGGFASANGFIIFDYRSATNFKFAGAYMGGKIWVIGHRDANSWLTDASFPDDGIGRGADYNLTLVLEGSQARLSVNGAEKVNHTFSGTFSGSIGLGLQDSVTEFDNFKAEPLPLPTPAEPLQLPGNIDFNDGQARNFEARSGLWRVVNGRYVGTPTPGADAVSTLLINGNPTTNLTIQVLVNAATPVGVFSSSNGFIIFDYQTPTNFKYAGAYMGSQLWVIGQRSDNGWQDYAVERDFSIFRGTNQTFSLKLQGRQAILSAGGVDKTYFTFTTNFSGPIGLGCLDSVTQFDDLNVTASAGPEVPTDATLPLYLDFNDGRFRHFEPQTGSWAVMKLAVTDGRYVVTPSAPGADAVSKLRINGNRATNLRIEALVKGRNPSGGLVSSNGFIIFDYRGAFDFKYAGAYMGGKVWVIGRRTANGWQDDAVVPDSIIERNRDYNLRLVLQGRQAKLFLVVDNVATEKAVVAFATDFGGSIGLGSLDSVAEFDNFRVEETTPPTPPQPGTLPFEINFDIDPPPYLDPATGIWVVSNGRYVGRPNAAGADAVSKLLIAGNPSTNLQIEVLVNGTVPSGVFVSSNGFIIFDYRSAFDFKYAGAYMGGKVWVIGRRTANGWQDDARVSDADLARGVDHNLKLTLQGRQAKLFVNNAATEKVAFTFGTDFSGAIALGCLDSVTQFDNLKVQAI